MSWTLATAAMIGLSFYGVQTVLSGPRGGSGVPATEAAYAPPPPVIPSARSSLPAAPAPSATASASVPAATAPPAGASAGVGGAPSPTTPASAPAPSGTAPSGTAPATPGPAPTSPPAGAVRTYRVTGGTVVLDVGPSSATLVSRTPNPGWTPQTWQQNGRLGVDFVDGRQVSAVVCSWNGHPPAVQTYNG